MTLWIRLLAALVLCAAGVAPGAVRAQVMPAPEVGLVGGAFAYDLGVRGNATSAFGGLRTRFPLSRWVLVEPSLAFTRLTADTVGPNADPVLSLLRLEFQGQVQVPVNRLRPYLGVGAGGMVDLRSERGPDAFLMSTLSAALGLAVDVGSTWSLGAEGRYRVIDNFDHSALELGLGLSTRF